jgi:arylsulfatase A-like enzyme
VPTILELAAVAEHLTFEGKSVARHLQRGEPAEYPAFSAWFYGSGDRFAQGIGARVRTAKHLRWNAVDTGSGSRPHKILDMARPYFDLVNDPGERAGRDAPNSEAERELALALRDAEDHWAALRERFGVGGIAGKPLSDDAQNAMRAVGYVGGK